jgi:hypothetical protein
MSGLFGTVGGLAELLRSDGIGADSPNGDGRGEGDAARVEGAS